MKESQKIAQHFKGGDNNDDNIDNDDNATTATMAAQEGITENIICQGAAEGETTL